jgi:predicted negative regulator of RcsB-dependent stress response
MPTTQPLPRDPVLDVEAFWFRHRREILIFVIIAIVAAAGWGAFQFYTTRRDLAAANQLAAAKTPQDYEELIAQHGNTPAAASASLLLAEAQRKDRKFTESNATLQAFIDKNPEHELVPTAKIAMASNLESTGKVDEALSLYKQTAEKYAKTYVAPLALISQVSLFKAKNQPDAARRACETVLSQYGDSFWANEAMRELRSLRPAPSAQSSGSAPPNPAAPSQFRPPMMLAPAAPPSDGASPKPK